MQTDALAAEYNSAKPFPHIAIEGFFPEERLRKVVAEINAAKIDPEAPGYGWFGKRRTSNLAEFPDEIRALVEEMNGHDFIAWLENVTGIEGLQPDPYLEGGGVHQIPPGGFLKIHTDFNWHRRLEMHRRVNVLLYLNEDWRDEWNGHIELWHEDDIDNPNGEAAARYAPTFGRMVIFSTTDFSYHGHPDKLACPEGVNRNSIALYYYTKDRPASEVRFGASPMTNYRARATEHLGLKHKLHQALIRAPALRKLLGR
jgi:hypothetical protein